jgi:RNA polymerase sigma-70 factor (ECF subfamily)
MTGGYMALGLEAAHVDTFDGVFAAQRDYVYGLAYALLRNSQDAEDVTQEVFVRVYKALPQYQPERASMRTWLARMVVNACHNHKQSNFFKGLFTHNNDNSNGNGNGKSNSDEILNLVDHSSWGAPEEQALQSELRRTLNEVLSRLRIEHRTVLVLHYYLDLSCPEIARIIECPQGTVYSRLHHARRLVQEEFERHAPGSNTEVK